MKNLTITATEARNKKYTGTVLSLKITKEWCTNHGYTMFDFTTEFKGETKTGSLTWYHEGVNKSHELHLHNANPKKASIYFDKVSVYNFR